MGHALRVLADAYNSDGPTREQQAERAYVQAVELALELGMRPAQAHCHLGLGRLHRLAGRLDQARFNLDEATSLYKTLGMTFWLPEAEAEQHQVTAAEARKDLAARPSRAKISGRQ
jgi:hypothetical protein